MPGHLFYIFLTENVLYTSTVWFDLFFIQDISSTVYFNGDSRSYVIICAISITVTLAAIFALTVFFAEKKCWKKSFSASKGKLLELRHRVTVKYTDYVQTLQYTAHFLNC